MRVEGERRSGGADFIVVPALVRVPWGAVLAAAASAIALIPFIYVVGQAVFFIESLVPGRSPDKELYGIEIMTVLAWILFPWTYLIFLVGILTLGLVANAALVHSGLTGAGWAAAAGGFTGAAVTAVCLGPLDAGVAAVFLSVSAGAAGAVGGWVFRRLVPA